MRLPNGQVVTTPYDNLVQHDPDWRSVVARSWADLPQWTPPRHQISRDPVILEYKQYLQYAGDFDIEGVAIPRRMQRSHDITTIATAGTLRDPKPKLNALLLTSAPYTTIASDMGGKRLTSHDVRFYEQLFFNVREEDGQLTESCHLRTYMSVPNGGMLDENSTEDQVWRLMASQFGYGVLVHYWGWRDAHGDVDVDSSFREYFRMAQASALRRNLTGQINTFDLNNLLSNYIQYEKVKFDTKEGQHAASKAEQALTSVVAMFAPKMLVAAELVDAQKEQLKLVAAKFASQSSIARQVIEDKGAVEGQKALLHLMDQHIAGAVT